MTKFRCESLFIYHRFHFSLFCQYCTAAWTHAVVEWWTHCKSWVRRLSIVLTVTVFIVVTVCLLVLPSSVILSLLSGENLSSPVFLLSNDQRDIGTLWKNAAHSFISMELRHCHSAGVNTEVFAVQLIRIRKQAENWNVLLSLVPVWICKLFTWQQQRVVCLALNPTTDKSTWTKQKSDFWDQSSCYMTDFDMGIVVGGFPLLDATLVHC